MKKLTLMFFMLFTSLCMNGSLFAQANSVGLNGSFTFNSIASAYAAIGVVGSPQLIELSSSYNGANEVYPVSLTLKTGTSSVNTITIRPSAGANGLSLTSAAVNNYMIRLDSCQWVVLDGRPGGVTSTAANYLSLSNTNTGNLAGTVYGVASRNCTIQYLNATAVVVNAGARNIALRSTATTTTDNNIVQYNVIRGGYIALDDSSGSTGSDFLRNNDVAQFYFIGIRGAAHNLEIRDNRVHSVTAVATAAPVRATQIQSNNILFTGNIVENIKTTGIAITHMLDFGLNNTISKNVFRNPNPTAAGFLQCVGVQFSGAGTVNFTENEISGLNLGLTPAASGTFLIGLTFSSNHTTPNLATINVTKNKIFDLSSPGTTNIRAVSCFPDTNAVVNFENNFFSIMAPNPNVTAIFGILIGNTANLNYTSNIYYNTIRIGGTHAGGVAGSVYGYGILKSNTQAGSTYRQKNNISIMERTSVVPGAFQLASWIPNTAGTIDIDYNTYYATDTTSGGVGWISTIYNNAGIAAYKTAASPHEQNSNATQVNFVSATDLHLTGASIGDPNLIGTPIPGITTDIDNNTRSVTSPYRGADEPAASTRTLNLTINFQAINLPTSMDDQDTIKVVLKSAGVGHATVDSAMGFGGSSIPDDFEFSNAVDGVPYYVVVYHRNSVPTWSASTVTFVSGAASYDFTTAQSQAFGNNQVLVGSEWSIYTGEVVKTFPAVVNLADITLIYNASTSFTSGPYVLTDLNWNGAVNLADIVFAYNNSNAFVSEKFPSPAPGQYQPVVENAVVNNPSVFVPRYVNADAIGDAALDAANMMDR